MECSNCGKRFTMLEDRRLLGCAGPGHQAFCLVCPPAYVCYYRCQARPVLRALAILGGAR